jgi:hypothetical protein
MQDNLQAQALTFSMGRFISLGLASLFICLTMILAVFTPFPVAMAAILYGRKKGYILMAACWILCTLLSVGIFQDPSFVLVYSYSLIFAVSMVEMFYRNISPMKTIVSFGVGINIMIFAVLGFGISSTGMTAKEFIVSEVEKRQDQLEEQKQLWLKSNNEEALSVVAMLDNPELLADSFLKEAPSYILISVFVVFWANIILVLRLIGALGNQVYSYKVKDLINFKMPEFFTVPVAIALLLSLLGTNLGSEWYEVVGVTLVKVFAVFYFFHGFGVYTAFLDALNIRGFFRTFLMVFTIMVAYWVVSIVGLFDTFFDFRKMFKKIKSKGE